MQAAVSELRSLTRLEAAYIRTPLKTTALDDLLASLPALQAVSLYFCDIDVWDTSDADSDTPWVWDIPHKRTQPDDFPQSLLRCLLLLHMSWREAPPHWQHLLVTVCLFHNRYQTAI